MAIPLDPKQIVSFEELLNVPSSPARSPHQVACREEDIHQAGVLGDGEGRTTGEEEETISSLGWDGFLVFRI